MFTASHNNSWDLIMHDMMMRWFKQHLNEANNREADYSFTYDREQFIIGTIAMFVALLTLAINLAVLFAICRTQSMQNSFGYLNVSHQIADCIILSIFVLWYSPMIMIGSAMDQSLIALKIVHFTAICMCGANHTSIFIAVGRYQALVHPLKYAQIFSHKQTLMFIAISWITAFVHHIASFFPGCYYYFDFRYYSWFHADTLCGEFLSWFVDMCYGFLMIIMIGGTDLATVYRLHQASKRCGEIPLLKTPESACCSEKLQRRKRKQEWRFFVQAFISSGVITLVFLTFHLLRKSFHLRLLHFFSGCLCVILAHSVNGVVLMALNKDIRWKIRHPFASRMEFRKRCASSWLEDNRHQKSSSSAASFKT